GIKNCCIEVKKKGEDIIFLRRIKPGGADRSYGVEVARLAGVPQLVIDRAKALLEELDAADINKSGRYKRKNNKPLDGQLDLLSAGALTKSERDVIDEIRSLDTTSL